MEWRDFQTGELVTSELYDHREGHLESENIIESASPELVAELTEELLKNHPRKGFSMVPAVRSTSSPSCWPAEISFSNQSSSEVRIFPISTGGRRVGNKRLQPGEDAKMVARLGGVFVVESEDGTIYEIHSPSMPSRPVILR